MYALLQEIVWLWINEFITNRRQADNLSLQQENATMPHQKRELTPWESLLKTIAEALVGNLPGIIKDGYDDGGITIPPYTNISLPEMQRFDIGQKLALCPLLSKPVENTLLTMTENTLNGLDTITSFGEITFPVQDVKLSVPLVFEKIVLTGNWKADSVCQRGSKPPVAGEHNGTYRVSYSKVQVTLDILLNQVATAATDVTITLTDKNSMWAEQPEFNPDKDVTFGPGTTRGQRIVLTALLRSQEIRSKLRDPVKQVVESSRLSDELLKVVNMMLSQLGF